MSRDFDRLVCQLVSGAGQFDTGDVPQRERCENEVDAVVQFRWNTHRFHGF